MNLYINALTQLSPSDISILRPILDSFRHKYGFPYYIDTPPGQTYNVCKVFSEIFDNRSGTCTCMCLDFTKGKEVDRTRKINKYLSTITWTPTFHVIVMDAFFMKVLTRKDNVELFDYHIINNTVDDTLPFSFDIRCLGYNRVMRIEGKLLELFNWGKDNYRLGITIHNRNSHGHPAICMTQRYEERPLDGNEFKTDDLVCRIDVNTDGRNINFDRLELEYIPRVSMYVDQSVFAVRFNLNNVDEYVEKIKAQIIVLSKESWRRVRCMYMVNGMMRDVVHKIVHLYLVI